MNIVCIPSGNDENIIRGAATSYGVPMILPPSYKTYDTIRYDTRGYFDVRSRADMSQLNLTHGTENQKVENRRKN